MRNPAASHLPAFFIAVAVAIAACSVLPTGERPKLGISNGTTLHVTLFVNGVRVADSPVGGPSPVIDSSRLPALPWLVEARSLSGRVLTSMTVEPGQVRKTTLPNGGFEYSGAIGRVDLSCGRLTIWAGAFDPHGPVPGEQPGEPGDCEP